MGLITSLSTTSLNQLLFPLPSQRSPQPSVLIFQQHFFFLPLSLSFLSCLTSSRSSSPSCQNSITFICRNTGEMLKLEVSLTFWKSAPWTRSPGSLLLGGERMLDCPYLLESEMHRVIRCKTEPYFSELNGRRDFCKLLLSNCSLLCSYATISVLLKKWLMLQITLERHFLFSCQHCALSLKKRAP